MKLGKDPATVYLFAAGVAGQVGCLLTVIVGGSVLLGLFLDNVLGTGRLFIFLLLVISIPLNLWAIYRYTLYQSKRLQAASQKKEDSISGN
jgi:F0F1-type ATP synthase assembly protein I